MCLIEAFSHRKSIARLITGTKAVNLDSGVARSISQKHFTGTMIRVIPFNAISGLGNPCDNWLDTMVDGKKLGFTGTKGRSV